MTTALARRILESSSLNVQLAGVEISDSWISPISFVDTWGEFL